MSDLDTREGLLARLPSAPAGRTGWPWTEETDPHIYTNIPSSHWPRISIVTPSFNQGSFLEETIRSVLLQNYPDLEFIIMDGGSTDESLNVIRRYQDHLAYWVSEKDNGQSSAINSGLGRATGRIWAYINSDDFYAPAAFHAAVTSFLADTSRQWVTGHAEYIDYRGDTVESLIPVPEKNWFDALVRWESAQRGTAIQVSNFMSRKVIERFGSFDESLDYCMDFDYGLRLMAVGIQPLIVPRVLAKARLHDRSKTVSQGSRGAFAREDVKVVRRFLKYLNPDDRLRIAAKLREHELSGLLCELSPSDFRGFLNGLFTLLLQRPDALFRRRLWGAVRAQWNPKQC